MDIEAKQKENDEVALRSRILLAFFVLLFITSFVHSTVSLSKDKNDKVRIAFVFISVILFPFYWIIYLITYLSGGFKN